MSTFLVQAGLELVSHLAHVTNGGAERRQNRRFCVENAAKTATFNSPRAFVGNAGSISVMPASDPHRQHPGAPRRVKLKWQPQPQPQPQPQLQLQGTRRYQSPGSSKPLPMRQVLRRQSPGINDPMLVQSPRTQRMRRR